MSEVKYQIVFNKKTNFKKIVFEIFKETLSSNYDEFDSDRGNEDIEFVYLKKVSEDKFILCINVEFNEIDTEIKKIIDDFNDKLQDNNLIDAVFKYSDEYLLNFLLDLHKTIFNIEMELREIISFIFIDTYKSNYYNFLRDFDIKVRYEQNNNIEKNEPERLKHLQKRCENEFFYFDFNQYISLMTPKSLSHEDFIYISSISDDFEKFKINLTERGIVKGIYKNFFEDVKSILDPIKRIRNCVAHNRMLAKKEFENYERYIKELTDLFTDFKKNLEFEDIEDYFTEKKAVVYAYIYLEEAPASHLYRQNSSTIQFEDGIEEDIDFGDMEFNQHEEESYEINVKKTLRNYLKENYNVENLTDEMIEIEHI